MSTPDPMEVVAGTSEAEAFLIALRSNLGSGDELYYFVRCMKSVPGDDRLRGACRHLQKQLERSLAVQAFNR